MFSCPCIRRGDSPCAGLWIRLRDRVPFAASSRIPLPSAHGPHWPVPAKRTHSVNQVRILFLGPLKTLLVLNHFFSPLTFLLRMNRNKRWGEIVRGSSWYVHFLCLVKPLFFPSFPLEGGGRKSPSSLFGCRCWRRVWSVIIEVE